MESESSPTPVNVSHRTVRCEVCGAALSDLDELKVHLEGHAEKAAEGDPPAPEAVRHKCPFCDSAFPTPEQLKAHIGSVHGK
jgi:Zinc finger, C2H2 type